MKGSRTTNPSHGGLHRVNTESLPKRGEHQYRPDADGGYHAGRGSPTDFDLNIAYANAY
jgi:hypothetical protein